MFEYKVTIKRVVDGDTVDVDIDLGFKMWLRGERVRLMGLDTPESRTRNLDEKRLGLASKERLKQVLKENKGDIVLRTSKEGKGKFGRILGSLIIGSTGQDLNQLMIDEGHARPYFGGSKSEFGEWVEYCDGKVWRWTKNGYVEVTNA
jgi:micrococcal nuclease